MTAILDDIIAKANVQPRDYQKRIVGQTDTNFNDVGVRSILIESPTGSGKTCMGLLSAKAQQVRHENFGVAWVAMRANLLSQAARENAKLGINVQDIEFVSMFCKEPPTVDKAGRPIKLLIVDEAQHDAANSMAHVHNVIKPEWTIGLTATPFRTDRLKLCFDKVIKDIGIHQLIELGFLSQYKLFTICEYTPQTVCETYLREPERWGKSVMFFLTTEEAALATRLLCEGGVRAKLVVGTQSVSEREQILQDFEDGKIDVLTNLFILTEGFDSPSLKTVFVRDSQRGPTIQMGGRVFRKHPGTEFKQIVQSKLTHWPMIRTAHPEEQLVWFPEEQEWRSYKLNPNINKVAMKSVLMSARSDVKLPEYFARHGSGKQRGRHMRGQNNGAPRSWEVMDHG